MRETQMGMKMIVSVLDSNSVLNFREVKLIYDLLPNGKYLDILNEWVFYVGMKGECER